MQGVLLLSTRPGEIDEVLSEERNVIIALAMTAFAATLLASFLLARTIAGPMRRLSEVADNVSRNINARHELPELAQRADEVGQMATAFREMTASLYRRIEASERFAQDVAHELKNPLTAARSTAEALAYARSPEQQQELVRQIQEELKRLNKLITDVSSASRLDAELALQETEPVDIREVLRTVVEIFRDKLSGDMCHIALEFAGQPHDAAAYVVRGHDARLGRVITNLLDNAISFSPQDGAITVRARRVGPEIEIVVEDEGPGIPQDKLEDVFKRFYSDRPQTDRTIGKNSGLGLSISREIINAYGGRIWADNRKLQPGSSSSSPRDQAELRDRRPPGVAGACFVVRLPAADRPQRGEPSRLPDAVELVHGTCVALGRSAALLRGPSGSGKSDLALRFLFLARRGPAALEAPTLVADDQVSLSRSGERLLAGPPDTIRGKLEVRGIGIVEVKSVADAELALVVDLTATHHDRAHAPGRRHDANAGIGPAPDQDFPVGTVRSHQAGHSSGARETQLIRTSPPLSACVAGAGSIIMRRFGQASAADGTG